MDRHTIDKILEAAIRAPSGDNVQPWQLKVSDNFTGINLYNLPDRDDSFFNYRQAASHIAHGAVIENIAISARNLGYKANISLFPDSENSEYVARIDLELTEKEIDPLYDAIFSRTTNRFHYQSFRLPDEDRQNLVAALDPISDVKGYFVDDPKIIKQLAKVLMINDRLVFERNELHGFLFDKIRWTQKQIEDTKDGIPVGTLGLNTFERPFFPIMRYWWFVNLANYFGLSRVIGAKCRHNCQNASMIGFLGIKKTDRLGFIKAGRAFQRVWLEATRQGLAFQPIVGLPLLIHRARAIGLDGFSHEQCQMVEECGSSLMDMLHVNNELELVIGFRLGKGPKIGIKSLRKPIT